MSAPDPYGQRHAMEDPTMVGTLQAQIEMVWPLERPLLERLGFDTVGRLADLGCGTGRFLLEAARAWPSLEAVGIDLFEPHVLRARTDLEAAGCDGVAVHVGDARDTGWDDGSFDVVTLRHIVHALGDRHALLAEAHRLLVPGGRCYVLAEDYKGLIAHTATEEGDRLFADAASAILATGTDLMHGRRAFGDLIEAGFDEVRVDPLVIDTSNTPRATMARMMRFWRDGYAAFIAEHQGASEASIRARFDEIVATYEDPTRYGCWLLFAVTGRKPGGSARS